MNTELIETEVLVLGSGVAGCTTALALADAGIPVTLVTRATRPEESNTYYAQGGIIYRGEHDTPEQLTADILLAGAGHSSPEAARILAEEGPAAVEQVLVERAGVQFDRGSDGRLEVIKEAAHSQPRIIHAADATGRAIEVGLINAVDGHPNIRLLAGHTAIDLLTPGHHARNRLAVYDPLRCVGAYVLDQQRGEVRRCIAKYTVLATGGLGQIFLRTTNPAGSRGDGLAMAYRAGAWAINSEFVQFHPTTFHHEQAPNFLISEAVRGAGARLVDADGEPFMQHYDAEWKDLAPRDVVARSIHQEMLRRDVPNMYLDLRSYIDQETIAEHFPNIAASCREYGIDIQRDLVPVVPGAHYFCGGVWVDAQGRTTIADLYAVGEVACTGVHGANRLASTSLLEGVVWGRRAAADIAGQIAGKVRYDAGEIPPWEPAGGRPPDLALIAQDMSSIRQVMWNYVGLVRTSERLARALRELRRLVVEIEWFYRETQVTDGLVGLRNAARAALTVAEAAWHNKESMGCHFRGREG